MKNKIENILGKLVAVSLFIMIIVGLGYLVVKKPILGSLVIGVNLAYFLVKLKSPLEKDERELEYEYYEQQEWIAKNMGPKGKR